MEQKTQITMLWVDDQRGPEKHFKNASKQQEPENPEGTKDMNYIAFRELMNMYDINFVWVKTFPEFANYITEHGVPEFVSFDRDLTKAPGYDGKNGSDCARWLSEYCKSKGIEIPKYFIHSANVNAYDEITSALATNTLFTPKNPKFKFKRHDKVELNEAKIRKIVKESLKKALKEGVGNPQMTQAYRTLIESFITIISERAKVDLGEESFNLVIDGVASMDEFRDDVTSLVKEKVFPLIDEIYDRIYTMYDFTGDAIYAAENGLGKGDHWNPMMRQS